MRSRMLWVSMLLLTAACGSATGAPDAGRREPRRNGPRGPVVLRLATQSDPTQPGREVRVELSRSGAAGPFARLATWDGERSLVPALPTDLGQGAVTLELARGLVRASDVERTLHALAQIGIPEVTVQLEGERPYAVRTQVGLLDFLYSFNVLLRAADTRWTLWTAGGYQSIWIMTPGPVGDPNEIVPLVEQIRSRRPARVIIAHGGGRAGAGAWLRRVRAACEACREVQCECYVGPEPIVDNGSPVAPEGTAFSGRVGVGEGGPAVSAVLAALGARAGADPSAAVRIPALDHCAFRPAGSSAPAAVSATLTVDAEGFARDLSGTPNPFPMRCIAEVLARRTYPPAPATYRITLRAEVSAEGRRVPNVRERLQGRNPTR